MCAARKNTVFAFLVCCFATASQAQIPNKEAAVGKPFIQHYTPKDYGAHVQNWGTVQDDRGVMYFANSTGILEYDGVSWKLITTDKSTHVRSLAIDQSGRIFVGAYGELGYIGYDSIGQPHFSSLGHKLDTANRDYLDVWKIFCKDDGVYFSSYKYLFRWTSSKENPDDGTFKVWKPSTHFQFAFSIGKKLFIQERHVGLKELVNDSLILIPGGDIFKDSWVFAMMEQNDGKMLIVDRTHGLYAYDGAKLVKVNTPAEQRILESRVFHGVALSNDLFALATNLDGVLIVNDKGELVRTINASNGLQNASATSLYLDRQNGLWVTLSNGIDRIEINSPFSLYENFFDESNAIQSIIRHEGDLYFASGVGVHVLREQPVTGQSELKKIDGITTQCWSFASIDNRLLAATSNGTFIIDNNERVKMISRGHARSLYKSRKDSTKVFEGQERRLQMISVRGDSLEKKLIAQGINDEFFFIDQDPEGYLWCSTVYNGIYRILIDSSGMLVSSEHLQLEHGLPSLKNNTSRMVNNQLVTSTQRGVYTFDAATNRFTIHPSFEKDFSQAEVSHLVSDQKGGVWVHGNGASKRFVGYGLMTDKGYSWTFAPFNRFIKYQIYTIYPDENGVVWFGGPDGVVRYDSKIENEYLRPYRALIRKVLIDRDSLIYAGFTPENFDLSIGHDFNALRFEFSASSYDDESANQYSYFLEGFDKNWSEWTNETKKDYTNLPDGEYTLRVKARNIYDHMSEEAALTFSILPAWYDTWWAFALYVTGIVMGVTAIVQWRFKQIRKEKEILEQIVSERTREVEMQADQLREQAEKLRELDHAKSRFFANISHEFRTPLTLISGCLEDLSNNVGRKEDKERLTIMRNNTLQLRQLIEQLLDLSKLENNKLKLSVEPVNPISFLNAITSSFSSWAGQKNIELKVQLPLLDGVAYLDPDVLEKIINNLLSNAIKFTSPGGHVLLSATWTDDEMVIFVRDDGPGIPSSKLSQIFDRFYQVDNSNTRNHQGSGIGLALVKELVSLHQGTISVESQLNEGTTFKVTIPIRENNYGISDVANAMREKKFPTSFAPISFGEYDDEIEQATENPVVLVVEDNIDLGRFIGDHLPHCDIILAANGKEGYTKALQYLPDLIISDVMMPEMDGVELCKRVKEDEKTSHIPVILLTAKADIESRLEGLKTGADDYMTKPFDNRELQTRVRNLIEQREKLRRHFSRTMVLKPKDIAITPPDEVFLNKVMVIIETHMSNSEFSVEDFQKEIGMSRMQLHRKLKALTGHSAGEFIRIQRLIRASDMLSKTNLNISEVCYQTGFTSLSYFAKCFKKQFGTGPKDFAALHSQQ